MAAEVAGLADGCACCSWRLERRRQFPCAAEIFGNRPWFRLFFDFMWCGRAVELVGIMPQNDLSTFLVELASFLRWSGCFGSWAQGRSSFPMVELRPDFMSSPRWTRSVTPMTRPDEALLPPPLHAGRGRLRAWWGRARPPKTGHFPSSPRWTRPTRPNGDPGPYNTFKGVPIESGLVVAFFESTGLEGGLVRILARSCFQVVRWAAAVAAVNLAAPKTRLKSAVEPGVAAVGLPCRRWTQCKHWAYRGVDCKVWRSRG